MKRLHMSLITMFISKRWKEHGLTENLSITETHKAGKHGGGSIMLWERLKT